MNRRTWILGGAGLAAAAAGAAWRAGGGLLSAAGAATAGPTGAADSADGALWAARFARPEGGTLDLAALRGRPLVLNFWATWCPPCVKEMPEIDRFAGPFQAAGGSVVGLAVDNPAAVRSFLARTPVHYAIGLAGFEGTDLSRKLGNVDGALPFTVVVDRAGRVAHRRLGASSYDELVAWTKGL
ncbi:MAG: TlpA family protein disulfide reductase [Burkholderiales bacterium]|nr:TlpA family protein disulfide reductase [Burkholderiales bacterium]